MADRALPDCPVCENQYLAIRTDVYKDGREFVYCDCCGAMATMPLWIAAQPLTALDHFIDDVEAAESAWQPIETAPVGVEMFLAAAIDYPISNARIYTTDPWVVWQSATGVFIRWPHQFAPTHWAPIPAMKGDQP